MVPLKGGTQLPIFGLGTFLSEPGEVPNAVQHALSSEGYLMVDTASMCESSRVKRACRWPS